MTEIQKFETSEVVVPCLALDETVHFFIDRLGFQLTTIFPADDPAVAVLAGHGLRLRLERGAGGPPGHIRLLTRDPGAVAGEERTLTAPNGTLIEIVDADPPLDIPPVRQSFSVQKLEGSDSWITGRAGMLYRDLVPDRQGGRFIASHIRIPDGGPVPDNVHFHKIRFQMIYCYKGWVRLVYEDQGEPFVMEAGDCVLQPPEIRHRVLESSDGLEVVEIGCPAEHLTCLDHEMPLPTGAIEPERDFGGQRFVFHVAKSARWVPWRHAGFEARDTGIGAATDGLAGARVVRPAATGSGGPWRHDGEFLFWFVLRGSMKLSVEGQADDRLGEGDAVVIPAGADYLASESSDDLEFLEVSLPAEL